MESKYLTLIINVFERLEPITESTIESKRNDFREKILDEQKQNKQWDLITKKDFLNNCEIAVEGLKTHVLNRIILLRNKIANPAILEMTFVLPDTNIKRKKDLEAVIKNTNELYGKDTRINIKSLVKTSKTEICLNDIEFIESVFETINFINREQTEYQPDDLIDTSAVEKIIFLNELGIIDFLITNTKAGISNSSLASVLNRITGIKTETIKSSLNRLSNKETTTTDHRHPYYTIKTVKKVKDKLEDLGFKPKA